MNSTVSVQVAGLLGPVLMAVVASEYLNFGIWEKVEPSLVYLNGLFLFVGGLAVVRYHNFWTEQWPLTITVTGWLILLAGLYRMFFPSGRQAPRSGGTNVLLFVLFLTGCFLTFKGYF
ncbi:hypothetical protein [Tellurirhabdus rosea]|uniref:hypothetical protein n=1 Tax=Tellurirhabdus rosea TaxID=2674997 RepID=UPI00224E9CAE|nr:hypothetical protein [Tellurirhabdus rosea]